MVTNGCSRPSAVAHARVPNHHYLASTAAHQVRRIRRAKCDLPVSSLLRKVTMLKALKRKCLKDDVGLGDTIARFTKATKLPKWAVRWLPHALYEKFDANLRQRFSIERFAHWFAVDVLKLPHCGCSNRQTRLNSVCSYYPATLTIGMPHRDDKEGVWGTVEGLRDQITEAGLQKYVEILVVDQSPPANGPNPLKTFCARVTQSGVPCRYEIADQTKGSAAAKNAVFRHAKPPHSEDDSDKVRGAKMGRHWVVCVDCHVHMQKGVVKHIYDYAAKNPNNLDLHYGCLTFDEDREKAFTSFSCWRRDQGVWQAKTPLIGGDLLLGTWKSDKDALKAGKPFEIEACGGWFVICRKAAWIGFHPLLKGHGGEEWYIAEAFRQLDRKVLCLPFAKASHRFIRTRPVDYGGDEMTIRNCVICWKSLGYDPDRLRTAFTWPQQQTRPDGTKFLKPLRDPAWINKIIDDTLAELKDYEERVNKSRPLRANPKLVDEPSIQEGEQYRESKFLSHFYKEGELSVHLPVLRSLAAKVPRILEYPSKDKASTWAFLAAQPESVRRLGASCGQAPADMQKYAGRTILTSACTGGSCSTGPDEGGMLFVSRDIERPVWDVLDQHKATTRHFMVVHGTEGLPKEEAEAWLAKSPEWRAVFAAGDSGGIVILQRTSSDISWSVERVPFPPPKAKPQEPSGIEMLELEYLGACKTPSDINEHLPTLRDLATRVVSVTEFGTRTGVSTRAFLAAQPEELHSYDITEVGDAATKLTEIAGETKLVFHSEDTLKAEIAATDLLFIDTLHTGPQVEAELNRHADRVGHFIVFHDTVTFGEHGEGHSATNPVEGLKAGMERFLSAHPEWTQIAEFGNNNGLTVWQRESSNITWPAPSSTTAPSGGLLIVEDFGS